MPGRSMRDMKAWCAELADLGRSVMREWYNHSWEQFEDEVGFDAAEHMIAQAKAEPDKTKARWAYLLQ